MACSSLLDVEILLVKRLSILLTRFSVAMSSLCKESCNFLSCSFTSSTSVSFLLGWCKLWSLLLKFCILELNSFDIYYIITDEKKERELGQYDGRSYREGLATYQPAPTGERRTEEEVGALWEGVEESQYLEWIAEGFESRDGARVQPLWDQQWWP